MHVLSSEEKNTLISAGALPSALQRLETALAPFSLPKLGSVETLAADTRKAETIYSAGEALLSALPPKPGRDEVQANAAETVKAILRRVRRTFARCYARTIYRRITEGHLRFVRAEELVHEVASLCPGLCPTPEQVQAELEVTLADKEGVEIAQSDFLSEIFSCKESGNHLIHAMLRPLRGSLELLEKFRRDGRLDLGTNELALKGSLGCIYFNNIAYLNAEDAITLLPLETAVDLVLLHPEIRMGLLRGNPVQHPKYRGRRIFSSGLNLSHLYQGKLPLMFYLTRDLGLVNKIYRGVSGNEYDPEGPEATQEKPWMAAVEGFAIGGGCQLLLVLDYVIAEKGAYCSLPARKEGIVPGVAPLRLARFLGERQAQAGILFDRPFPVDSPEGSALINEVVPPEEIDAAIERIATGMAGSGVVSAGANRKAMRVGAETIDLFRQYMALFCRVEADCHFSPALVSNLQRHWISRNRPEP